MTHDHLAYGWINPIMGLGFALAGSFLGLTCMVNARNTPQGAGRVKWLVFASLAIGGTGIWMMHFIAMIGFTVKDSPVRYDLAITIASLVISIVSVGLGLFVVGMGNSTLKKIFGGGVLTGLGVVSMHYTGMAAVNLSGTLHYDHVWVAVSIAIALVAATAALYFTTWVRGRGSFIMASVIMSIAVCGMHYTGMAGISVEIHNQGRNSVDGYEPLLLLIPILILATVAIIGLIFGVLGEQETSDEETIAALENEALRYDARVRNLVSTSPDSADQSPTPQTSAFWEPNSYQDAPDNNLNAPSRAERMGTTARALPLRSQLDRHEN